MVRMNSNYRKNKTKPNSRLPDTRNKNEVKNKRYLLTKTSGNIAVEWVISSPFTMFLIFFSVMFLIFCINFYVANHTAFTLAQNLNMGDTGYLSASTQGASYSLAIPTKEYTTGVLFTPERTGNRTVTVTTTNNSVFNNAVRYFVKEMRDRNGFKLPYSTLRSVDCRIYDRYPHERTGFNLNKGETESGDMVVVNISYSFLGWINYNVRGYSFII